MKEKIIQLCNEVLKNDGVNSPTTDCSGIACSICPFKNVASTCQGLSPTQNIIIANEYLNRVKETIPTDNVNSPTHYNIGKIEVIEAIEDWKLNFNLGNAIKYIARCEHKENKKQDLEKAKWYIERELRKCK